MSIVTEPEKIKRLEDLFSESSETVGSSGLDGSLVTDSDLLTRLEKQFSTEIRGGRQALLEEVYQPETDKPSWADWVAPSLSISTSLAAGIPAARKGAMLGSAFPPYGAAVGATAAGLVATLPLVFGSEFAGSAVEDYVEGREFDPDRAFQEAVDAAQTDAIIQIALPVIGTGAKTVFTAGKQALTGKAGLTDDAIETVVEFQKKLKNYDPTATLLPVMASRGAKTYATQIASVSQLSKRTVEKLLTTYDKYMGAQINDVMQQFRGATPGEQGQALQTFIKQSEAAIDDIVDPIYKNIDALGKNVIIDTTKAGKDLALKLQKEYRGKGKPAYPTDATKRAVDDLLNLPSDLNFFEAHKRLSKVKQRLHNAQTSTTRDGDLIDVLKQTADMYKGVMDDTATKLSPQLRKEYEEVTNFYSKSKDVVTQSFLDKAMKVLDPSQIGAMITQEGLEVPVKQIKELKKLAAEMKGRLPKGSKVTGLDLDPLEGIRKGYLESLFKLGGEGGQSSLVSFQKKLQEPKFKATFDELFKGTAVPKQIDTILKELNVLESINKTGGGMQLFVAGAEYGVVKGSNPNILASIRDLVPSFLANRAIKQKSVDKLINMIKAATEAEKRGVRLSPSYAMELNNLLGVIKVGQGVGAASGTIE